MDRITSINIGLVKNLTGKEGGVIVKGHNGPIVSTDLAPVHSSSSKQLKVQKMEAENKHNFRPPALESDLDSISNNLPHNMKEKLNLNAMSTKNINKNGMRLGTTDAEVHCDPTSEMAKDPDSNSKGFQGKPLDLKRPTYFPESQRQFSSISSHPMKCSSPLSPIKPVNAFNNFDCKSASRSEMQPNAAICNGHMASEGTSSNSITISDISLSSDKSLDSSFSCTGARPRNRNTSDSSSQSAQQPLCLCEEGIIADVSSSTTSENSCKLQASTVPDRASFIPNNITDIDSGPSLNIKYVNYENENQMEAVMRLIQKDLSEPYSIYTYRYFIHNWPKLCFLAMQKSEIIGAIVCKLDVHKKVTARGYIAMLAVDQRYRKRRIGSNLVQRAIRAMADDEADEVVLETEITNKPALQLYENLGFVRDKRLFRYYLNGVDALRLKLWLR